MARKQIDSDGGGNSAAVERYLAVAKALGSKSRAAYKWFTGSDEGQRKLSLVWRDGDVLAVATRYGPDGGPQVLFANGEDGVAATLALAGLMGDDSNWKVDKPYDKK